MNKILIAGLVAAAFVTPAVAQTTSPGVMLPGLLDMQAALELCTGMNGCIAKLKAGTMTPREAVDCIYSAQKLEAKKNGTKFTHAEELQIDHAERSCLAGLARK